MGLITMAALGDPVLVRHLPDEDPEADPDLRSGQADTVGGVVRLVHVLDEGAQVVVELRHERGGPVEHRARRR